MQDPLVPAEPGLIAPTGIERLAAAAAHASAVTGMPVLGPAIIYATFGLIARSQFVRSQALQATLFHALVSVLLGTLLATTVLLWQLILLGWPFAIVATGITAIVFLWACWHITLAAVWAFRGKAYKLPIVGIIEPR